jgi:hypothetical protein
VGKKERICEGKVEGGGDREGDRDGWWWTEKNFISGVPASLSRSHLAVYQKKEKKKRKKKERKNCREYSPNGVPAHRDAARLKEVDNLCLLLLGRRVELIERLQEVALDVLETWHLACFARCCVCVVLEGSSCGRWELVLVVVWRDGKVNFKVRRDFMVRKKRG